MFSELDVERFWKRVNKTGGCWLWTGSDSGKGYGCMQIGGRVMSTHRISYIIHFGKIKNGLFVCHKCDIKRCVNPDHLFLGTAKDNLRDAIMKGRFFSGEKSPNAKLTNGIVKEIISLRKNGMTVREIAKLINKNKSTVKSVVNGRNWKGITGLQRPMPRGNLEGKIFLK